MADVVPRMMDLSPAKVQALFDGAWILYWNMADRGELYVDDPEEYLGHPTTETLVEYNEVEFLRDGLEAVCGIELRKFTLECDAVAALPPFPRPVLQDWVMRLLLREQGALLVALRGCDLVPKLPLESAPRQLTAAIRGFTPVPADPRETDAEPGCFMSMKIPMGVRFSELGHYPQHWVSHVMHAVEGLACRYPEEWARQLWYELYLRFCHSLHVNPESFEQYVTRLGEDRIASGTVVS